MNRDEAWQDYRCERSVYRNALAINVGVDIAAQRLDLAVEAVAAESVAVALADPLARLDALADCDDGWMELKWNTPKGWVGVRIMTEPAKLQVRYYYNGWRDCTRADALALLAGKGDTHDA